MGSRPLCQGSTESWSRGQAPGEQTGVLQRLAFPCGNTSWLNHPSGFEPEITSSPAIFQGGLEAALWAFLSPPSAHPGRSARAYRNEQSLTVSMGCSARDIWASCQG